MPIDHVAAIRRESELLRRAVAAGEPSAEVAACPGWALGDLAAHIGEVQRSWAWIVGTGATEQPAWADAPAWVADPPQPDRVDAWLEEGTELLCRALEGADPERPTWSWWQGPHVVGQIARHQVHEAAVHRWDAQEAAAGGDVEPDPFPVEQAVDGIDELLHVTHGANERPYAGMTGVLVVQPDDAESGWTVDLTAERPVVRAGAASMSTCRLMGPASDVLLLLFGRPRTFRYRGEAGLLTDFLGWTDLT